MALTGSSHTRTGAAVWIRAATVQWWNNWKYKNETVSLLKKKKKKVSECFILQKLLYFCLYPVVYFLRWKLSFSSALIPRYFLTMNKLNKIKLKQRIFCIKMSCLYQLHQNACPSFFFEFVLLLFWITLNLPSLQRLTHLLWNDSIPKETI